MKPPFERSARQIVELADALQAEPLEQPRDLIVKPQSLDGKRRERLPDLSLRNDDGRRMRAACERMRAAQGLGESDSRAETEPRESHRHVVEESAGAAEEMRHARHVEPQSIVAVDIERGAVAA